MMKKVLLSAIAFMMSAVFVLGCSSTKQSIWEDAEIQTSAESTALSYVQDDVNYSIQEIIHLQNFLLARETPDFNGKDYDFNDDGKWNAFDLCLMKQSYLKNQQKPIENDNDILVAYFSRTGTTEQIAEYLIDLTGADRFEIKAAFPYTDEDINYSNSSCRANKEQNDKSVRPEIADTLENMDHYDTIFVGYPIWWSQEPRIIDTFLESYDFSDKTVIPFCTSGSSGITTSESNIKNLGVEYGELLNGKRFSADSTKDDVSDWLDTLPISEKEHETKMNIEVNGHLLTATLADNSSAKAFAELIKSEPLTINMSDYANFEKVGKLPENLPRNDEQITTEAGDIILYQGNQITIYYDENTWNFTRIGKINNITQTELKEILGTGSVSVTFF